MVHVITDFWADLTTLAITNMWMNPEQPLDEKAQKKLLTKWNNVRQGNQRTYEMATKMLMPESPREELLDVLQVLRSSIWLPFRLRVSLVSRGLPVMRAAKE